MTRADAPQPEPDGHDQAASPLAHHFHSRAQQYDSARLGMWIFLVTEILFFGGLFCAYAVYRANRPEAFALGHYFLDVPLGALNTLVLITSSLTMAWAVRSAQLGQSRALAGLLAATILLGLVFVGIKSFEYKHKWDHRFVPGQERIEYWFSGKPAGKAPSSLPPKKFRPDRDYIKEHLEQAGYEHLDAKTLDRYVDKLRTFMGIYFSLTALHALHVLIGIGVLTWLFLGTFRGRFGRHRFTPVDMVGLYWHLVDLIWIYLFPLLYLIP